MAMLCKDVWESMIFPKLGLGDQIRFSAVCRSWRSMAVENQNLMNPIPWLLISRDEATNTATFLSLAESKIYKLTLTPSTSDSKNFCTGSSQGYLVIATPRNRDTNTIPLTHSIFLYDPFSHTHIHLPMQYKSPRYQQKSAHKIQYYFHKVIVSSRFVVSAMTSRMSDIIEMCTPGDQEWSVFGDDEEMIQEREKNQYLRDWDFSDILFCKEMLYGLTHTNRLVCFEYRDSKTIPLHKLLNVVRMSSPEDDNFKFTTSYLVESCGELLMVYRFSNLEIYQSPRTSAFVTGKFMIFRLDQSTDPFQWVELHNLGNQMLFLGRNSSLSISAQGISQMKGNCIYFTEDFWPYFEFGGSVNNVFSDNGVYHLDDGRFEPIFPVGVGESLSFVSRPFWLTPNITLKHFLIH